MSRKFIFGAIAALIITACGQNSGSAHQEQSPASNAEPKANILVVVDVQRDFFDPAGHLYVAGSEELPDKIAAIAPQYDAIVFTLDWHPGNHCSFAAQGGPWPPHCVAYTQGAGLPDSFADILAQGGDKVQLFFKGDEQDKEQYGAFEELGEGIIRTWFENCESIDVCGIAGDYCVKESTANILKAVPAEKVSILTGCVRSIDDGSVLKAFIEETGISAK